MKLNTKEKRKLRNRKKLKKVNVNRYRVSINKSLKNISVQIIDDNSIEVIASNDINKSSFKIYDISGKLVQENSFNNNITIYTKSFEKGTYIMNFYINENIVESKKILVQ